MNQIAAFILRTVATSATKPWADRREFDRGLKHGARLIPPDHIAAYCDLVQAADLLAR